jgi:phenol 2-monooxygenase
LHSAPNNLLNVTPVQPPIASILAGERGPDVSLSRLGTSESTPLQRILQNKGNFNVLIFAGVPQSTQPKLEKMRKYLDRDNNFTKAYGPNVVSTLTIFGLAGTGASDVMSGLRPFGKSYYDITQKAHEMYGVDPHQGALIVMRPDGYLGRVVHLDEPEALEEYFNRFLIPLSARQPAKLQNGHGYHHA